MNCIESTSTNSRRTTTLTIYRKRQREVGVLKKTIYEDLDLDLRSARRCFHHFRFATPIAFRDFAECRCGLDPVAEARVTRCAASSGCRTMNIPGFFSFVV